MPPLDYVHTLRLEGAKLMLEPTELPVEAIAHEVGFQDTSFLGHLFKRKVALTPTVPASLRGAGAAVAEVTQTA